MRLRCLEEWELERMGLHVLAVYAKHWWHRRGLAWKLHTLMGWVRVILLP